VIKSLKSEIKELRKMKKRGNEDMEDVKLNAMSDTKLVRMQNEYAIAKSEVLKE